MRKLVIASAVLMAGFASFAALATTAQAKSAIVSATKLSASNNVTRFEADLSVGIGFSATAVESPYRVIIDLADTNFDLPAGAGRKVTGLVSAFRYGLVEEGKSRIVLDTKGPVLITKSVIVPAKGKKPAHIMVELSSTTPENFQATFAKDHPEILQALPDQTASTSKAPASPTTDQNGDMKTIVIDPGHGGIDPGAISANKTKEKDVVLAFGQALAEALVKTGHYHVVMTRDKDAFIPLNDRVKIAHDAKADLFIAIHADTVDEADVRGTTIYTVSDKATDAVAEAMAQKENRADLIAGIDLGSQTKTVSDILINLAQRESKNQAMYFSKKAVAQLQPVAHFTAQPIRSAAFVVLKAPDVPSVLVELGYLSSAEDEKLLSSSDWRAKMAAAMAAAVNDYFAPPARVSAKQ